MPINMLRLAIEEITNIGQLVAPVARKIVNKHKAIPAPTVLASPTQVFLSVH